MRLAVLILVAEAAAATSAYAADAVLLEDREMDAVTAGTSALFEFDAAAVGGTFASTIADGTASAYESAIDGQPQNQAIGASAAGHSVAIGLGTGASSSSNVVPVTDTSTGPLAVNAGMSMTIVTPYSSMSLGWSHSSTSLYNPFALFAD